MATEMAQEFQYERPLDQGRWDHSRRLAAMDERIHGILAEQKPKKEWKFEMK